MPENQVQPRRQLPRPYRKQRTRGLLTYKGALVSRAVLTSAAQGRQDWQGRRPSLHGRPNTPPEPPGKRLFDVALAIPALLLLAPLLALIALAVRLDTPGPALFRQTRTGKGRRPFVILKFRTMQAALADGCAVAHARRPLRRGSGATDDGATADSDERCFRGRLRAIQANAASPGITRTGRFLRASRLDELPQLFNVLRGDMSLVGPRPHMPELDALFAPALPHIYRRYAVRPGMTGLAQINGACGPTPDVRSMRRRLDRDLDYLCAWSLAGDLRLLAATPWRLLVSGVSENEVGAPFGEACKASWQMPNQRRQRQARILSGRETSPFHKKNAPVAEFDQSMFRKIPFIPECEDADASAF